MGKVKSTADIRFDVRHQGRHKLAPVVAGEDYFAALDARIAAGKRTEAHRAHGGSLRHVDARYERSEELLRHLTYLCIVQRPFRCLVSIAVPSEKSLDIVVLLTRQFSGAGRGRSCRQGSKKIWNGSNL